jgi:hypothetical protein
VRREKMRRNKTILTFILVWIPLLALLAVGMFVPSIAASNQAVGTSSGWLSAGVFSIGIVSAGVFSVGVFSAGVFSLGIFSTGIFSLGVFSFGTYVFGIWVTGRYLYGVRRQPLE